MKRSTLTLLLVIPAVLLSAQPKIEFDHVRHDFGVIKEEAGKREAVFTFTNKGDQPLAITRVQTSCGCTASDYTKSPVAPGAKGFVTAVFDPRDQKTRFAKSITVYSNANPNVVVLIIEGEVSPREKTVEELYTFEVGPVRFQTNHLAFAKTKKNEKKTAEMPVINTSKSPVTIEFETTPPHLAIKAVPLTLKPGEKGTVQATYDANLNPSAWGGVNDLVRIKINGEQQKNIFLYVSATLVEDFSGLSEKDLENAPVFKLESNTAEIGKVEQNTSTDVEYHFTNEGKSDLIIRHVRATCGCTALMPTENIIKPGETGTIKAKFNSGHYKGNIYKNVFVYTNDPKNSEVMLMIKGEVLVPEEEGK